MEVKTFNLLSDIFSRDGRLYERLVKRFLQTRFSVGKLQLHEDDKVLSFGSSDGPEATIIVHNKLFYKLCILNGDIGFGESYELGYWSSPNVVAVFKWIISNVEDSGIMSGSQDKVNWMGILQRAKRIKHKLRSNSKSGSLRNISQHYDLNNDFFELFLDETMTYSCGIFLAADSNLQQAQEAKYEALCRDLDLQKDDEVLEVGCGWGGFASYAAKNYGCRVHGITISQEQLNYAQKRIKDEGLCHLVTLEFLDYRDLKGEFDKIVSIEMIEAVGDDFLDQYFKTLTKLLRPEGVLTIQAITSPDSRYDEFKSSVDWIQTYIFPGSLLPSIGRMNQAINKVSDLHLVNARDIGPHYAKTLRIWRERFFNNIKEIKKLSFDDRFIRRWDYYLSYCEAAFISRNISDVQLTWLRPNNKSYKLGDYAAE